MCLVGLEKLIPPLSHLLLSLMILIHCMCPFITFLLEIAAHTCPHISPFRNFSCTFLTHFEQESMTVCRLSFMLQPHVRQESSSWVRVSLMLQSYRIQQSVLGPHGISLLSQQLISVRNLYFLCPALRCPCFAGLQSVVAGSSTLSFTPLQHVARP